MFGDFLSLDHILCHKRTLVVIDQHRDGSGTPLREEFNGEGMNYCANRYNFTFSEETASAFTMARMRVEALKMCRHADDSCRCNAINISAVNDVLMVLATTRRLEK